MTKVCQPHKITAKAYLKQTFLLNQKIEAALLELARLRDLSTSIQSPKLTKDKIKSTTEKRKVEIIINKIIRTETRINNDIDKLVDLQEEIKTHIENIENEKLRLILHKRYICLQKWEEIAVDLDLSFRRITQLHGSALSALQKIL